MKNLISIRSGSSTMSVLRSELDRIEHKTGHRPTDWLSEIYEEAYEEYMTDTGFDWNGFTLHLSCVADSFIDFIIDHYQHLNMNM